jgi:hypothetical protein
MVYCKMRSFKPSEGFIVGWHSKTHTHNFSLNALIITTHVRKYDHGGFNNNINKAHLVSNPWENIDSFKLVQSDSQY